MKKIILFFSILFISVPVMALNLDSKSAILIESTTGEILYENNSHEKLAPASMTKICSMLLVVEAIEDGIIAWDDVISVSSNASRMGGSQILLETNEEMSIKDLFKGVAVASGNDAVVALAEAVAGDEEEFVAMMNNKVKELGLTDTNFKNAHGLDEANHYSTAYDMAILSRELIKHDKVLEYTSIYEDYLRKGTDREFWLVNTNKLVRFKKGVDGLKTGYTPEAGYCLSATMEKDNMRLISVVMKSGSSALRSSDTSALLDYGYAKYKLANIVNKDDVLCKRDVLNGKVDEVSIVPIDDLSILINKKDNIDKTYEIEIDELKAPIKKGDVVGYLTSNGKKVELTVEYDVDKSNFFMMYLKNLYRVVIGD